MGCFGESVAHFAGRAIGEETDWVNVFAGGTGGDENRLSGEIVAQAEDFANFLYDGFGGGQAPGAVMRRPGSLHRDQLRERRGRAARLDFVVWRDAPTC